MTEQTQSFPKLTVNDIPHVPEEEREDYLFVRQKIVRAIESGATELEVRKENSEGNLLTIVISQVPKEFKQLAPVLTKIKLWRFDYLRSLRVFASCENLQVLRLWSAVKINDLTPLKKLMNLYDLTLTGTQSITDLTPLVGLTSLRELWLGRSEALKDLSPLIALPSLDNLNINGCRQITDLTPVLSLKNLQHLDIEDAFAELSFDTFIGLLKLPHLTTLKARNLNIPGVPKELTENMENFQVLRDWFEYNHPEIDLGTVSDTEPEPESEQAPEPDKTSDQLASTAASSSPSTSSKPRVKSSAITNPAAQVYLSYAWGRDHDEHQQVSEAIVAALSQDPSIEILRDRDVMKTGDSIKRFEQAIGQALQVVMIFSDKYLHSEHCMREFAYVYKAAMENEQLFHKRVIPVVLDEVSIDSARGRLAYLQHWKQEAEHLEAAARDHLDPKLTEEAKLYRDIANSLASGLSWSADILLNREWNKYKNDNFAELVALVKQRIRENQK